MIEISLSGVSDWAELGASWRALEARSQCSFFQSWTWMGCLASERFNDPVLLQARQDGRLVAMGLFNRRRGMFGRETLWLGETGDPALDTVFIEWNGLLVETGAPPELHAACLRAARRAPVGGVAPRLARRVVLSGVDASVLEAARLVQPRVWLRRSLAAPYVDLAGLRASGRDYLETLGSNTRYQLRRSQRAYAGTGELVLSRASSAAEALAFLDGLAALHQAAWTSRGRPGAFAEPWFLRFHQALIERGFERGEIALLRLAAAGRVVGFLYNYEMRGASLAYQSGFDYASAAHHQRPGLTCHHLAIMDAASRGMDRYDFLAGEDRYKRNLADASAMLHWAELGGAWSARRTTGFLWNWIRAAAGVSTA